MKVTTSNSCRFVPVNIQLDKPEELLILLAVVGELNQHTIKRLIREYTLVDPLTYDMVDEYIGGKFDFIQKLYDALKSQTETQMLIVKD